MQIEPISISSICGGAIPEVFERVLQEVLDNITDPNTSDMKARAINIQLTFKPMAGRTGAEIAFQCSSKLSPVAAIKSSVFLAKQDGTLRAFARDVNQQVMFVEKESTGIKAVK